ncbi:hypothetical protein [Polyangium spumosum]|uniref:Outer membrane beta-barrel protein n=1 Tax=Polyangium spumosum TaxID=889282 RepID=A0A6N7PF04_9BACT|nr:hypothetical protein [Polyangium spumosum]MRG90407.1 hypothetical protein [Polyangium spumosum]
MKRSRVLVIILALGTLTNAASAKDPTDPYAPDDPEPEPPPRPYQINGFFEYRFSLIRAESAVHGIEYSYLANTHVRLGAALSLPFGASSREYCWETDVGLSPDCAFNYVAPLGFVEAHALPNSIFDPWARVGFGLAFMGSQYDQLDFDPLTVEGMLVGSLGFDIHAGPVVVGAYGTTNLFMGRHAPVFGPGVRLGGRF